MNTKKFFLISFLIVVFLLKSKIYMHNPLDPEQLQRSNNKEEAIKKFIALLIQYFKITSSIESYKNIKKIFELTKNNKITMIKEEKLAIAGSDNFSQDTEKDILLLLKKKYEKIINYFLDKYFIPETKKTINEYSPAEWNLLLDIQNKIENNIENFSGLTTTEKNILLSNLLEGKNDQSILLRIKFEKIFHTSGNIQDETFFDRSIRNYIENTIEYFLMTKDYDQKTIDTNIVFLLNKWKKINIKIKNTILLNLPNNRRDYFTQQILNANTIRYEEMRQAFKTIRKKLTEQLETTRQDIPRWEGEGGRHETMNNNHKGKGRKKNNNFTEKNKFNFSTQKPFPFLSLSTIATQQLANNLFHKKLNQNKIENTKILVNNTSLPNTSILQAPTVWGTLAKGLKKILRK